MEEVKTEDKEPYIIQGFSGDKKKLNQSEINTLFKDLFESFNINFLIGAGYSYEKLKTLGDLEGKIEANSITNKEDPVKRDVIESVILYDFFINSIYPHKKDIEENDAFENSNNFINHLDRMLSKRNDKNLLNRVNIFSTNYDMFIELSLEAGGVYYNDGFSGRLKPKFSTQNYNKIVKKIVQLTERESQIPTINLYKIHGSLSWETCAEGVFYKTNQVNDLENIYQTGKIFEKEVFDYKVKEDKSNIDEIIKKANGVAFELQPGEECEVKRFEDLYKSLHIINPTKKKFEETVFMDIYYDLLRMYSNEMEKDNTILFVFGFSFRDEHIYNITKRALSNPSMLMYIFIFSSEELDFFKEKFNSFHNVFYVYRKIGYLDLKELNVLMYGGHNE